MPRIPINPVSLPLVRHILRDLNIYPEECSLPIIGGVQYVDLNASSLVEAGNVLTRFKAEGVVILWNQVATAPPDEIETPIPVLTALNPASAPHNSSLTLIAIGSNFVRGCEITFRGKPRPTTFIDSDNLSTPLTNKDITPPGVYPVTVVTPVEFFGSEVRYFTST